MGTFRAALPDNIQLPFHAGEAKKTVARLFISESRLTEESRSA